MVTSTPIKFSTSVGTNTPTLGFSTSTPKFDRLEHSGTEIHDIKPISKSNNSTQSEFDSRLQLSPVVKREFGVNTDKKSLECSKIVAVQDIKPSVPSKKRTSATNTVLRMNELMTNRDMLQQIEEALTKYQESLQKKKSALPSKEVQCLLEEKKQSKDIGIQVMELFKMRCNVSVMVKPKTCEVGIGGNLGPGTKSIGVGPDQITTPKVSLNSMNTRSHSFNYGDTYKLKKKKFLVKSIVITVKD